MHGCKKLMVLLTVSFFGGSAAACETATATADAPTVIEGQVERFRPRRDSLTLRVDRRRRILTLDGNVRISVNGKEAPAEWLTAGTTVRATLAQPKPPSDHQRSARGGPGARRATRSGSDPLVSAIEIVTQQATGTVRSSPGRDYLRIAVHRPTTTQPTRADDATEHADHPSDAQPSATRVNVEQASASKPVRPTPVSRRRAHVSPWMTFRMVRETRVRQNESRLRTHDVREGQTVAVLYIPRRRESIALEVNIVERPKRQSPSVRVRLDGPPADSPLVERRLQGNRP